ncbi:conjugal transfer protein [Dietzia sp. 179-F 9C3 NHS]|uniref:conjugal transfer protein n=1 Tax=Dietzia sp. 179-F 9C3 NHS TaxID=3374295 RepID=UPI003879449E
MSRLVLPPGAFPAPTGDGKTAMFPKSDIPPDLEPAPTGDGADATNVREALRCLAGVTAWPESHSAPEPAPAAPTSPAPPRAGRAPEPALPYEDVDGERRYLHLADVDGGIVATTADGQPLARTDEHGQPIRDTDGNDELIWVDSDGYEVPPPELGSEHDDSGKKGGALSRLFTMAGTRGHSDTDDAPTVDYYDANGVKISGFDVVPPGAPPVSNTRARGKRLLYAAGGLVGLLTASALVLGVAMGSSRIPAQGAISPSEATAYRLSTFPVESAASFGARYLTACFTHGDSAQMEQRSATLTSMAAGNVARECGWQSGGKTQDASSVVFNGFVAPVDGYETGQAAFLGFDVVIDGEAMATSVPVWVGPTEGGGMAMQIVGDVGLSPTIPVAAAPMPQPSRNVDQELGGELTGSVIEPFLTAWAASDARQMNLLTAREASTNVRNGLDGAVTRPQVRTVVAHPDKPINPSQPVTYDNGDTVTVNVALTWTMSNSEATQEAGYRLYLVREADRWLVTDIQNGMIDNSGSRSSGEGGYNDAPSSRDSSSSGGLSSNSPTTSAGAPGGSSSGGLGSVDDLQSGDDSSTGESGTSRPDTP